MGRDERLRTVLNEMGMSDSLGWKDVLSECAIECERIERERDAAVKHADEMVARFNELYNKYTIACVERNEAISRNDFMYRGIIAYRASFGCHNAEGWEPVHGCAACAWEQSIAGDDGLSSAAETASMQDEAASSDNTGDFTIVDSNVERDCDGECDSDDGLVLPLPDAKVAQLNPGIRETVKWLRRNGFNTCDSGVGMTRDDERDMGCAYVHMTVEPERMVEESRRLARVLSAAGVPIGYMHYDDDADMTTLPSIECSYSPVKPNVEVIVKGFESISLNTGIISLYDVDDKMLRDAMGGTWRAVEDEDGHQS